MSPEPRGGACLDWHGEALVLRPDGSVLWPAGGTLFVADLHLGKGAAFRARGVPVPTGGTRDDLARLGRALEETGAERLVMLGDLFHARESRAPHVEAALAAWRRRHRKVEVVLVRGNHDLHAGDPSPEARVATFGEPLAMGPFRLWHTPGGTEGAPEAPVLAGHLHPVARLRGPGGDRARLPCFWVRPATLVLPAWGGFTGGHPVEVGPGDRVFVAVEEAVVEVGVEVG